MSSTTNHQSPPNNTDVDIRGVLRSAAAGTLDSGRIAEISDPTREQMSEFRIYWQELDVAARRHLVREMTRLAGDDLSLDFTRYLRATMRDPDPEVRAVAIAGLWEDDSASFLRELCELTEHEEEAAVHEVIAKTLGSFSYRAELDELGDSDTANLRHALRTLLTSGGNWMVRRRALESFAFFGHDPAVHEAIESAAASDFEQERAGAIAAMGNTLDERWTSIVRQELANEDPDIRCEAARAAGQFEDTESIDQLAQMTDDEDEEVQRVAVSSIGRIGGRKAVETLRYLRTQVPEELQSAVDDALKEARFWLDEG